MKHTLEAPLQSCLYEGLVTHQRQTPTPHRFQYAVSMIWLDLDELEGSDALRRLVPRRRWATHAFLRSDHCGSGEQPLGESIRARVAEETGWRPEGAIRLLTQLRYFGFYFSPLNLFYCYDRRGSLLAIVAEVNNTPWGEQHCYVLWSGNRWEVTAGDAPPGPLRGPLRFRHPKRFHVSPFMPMQLDYLWTLSPPGEQLAATIVNLADDRPVFSASIRLRRRALVRAEMHRTLIRYPLMTCRIFGAIYWQALRLWWKRCPTYQHPSKKNAQPTAPLMQEGSATRCG